MTTPTTPPRAARRAASRNGKGGSNGAGQVNGVLGAIRREASPPPKDVPIFADRDEAITLGRRTFHIANLTTWGTRAATEYLSTPGNYPPRLMVGAYETSGEQLYQGAITSGDFGPLFGFMQYAIAESDLNEGAEAGGKRGVFTIRDLWAAKGQQIIHALNLFMKHDGLAWLDSMVKNSSAAVQAQMDQAVKELAPALAREMLAEMTERRQTNGETMTNGEIESETTDPPVTNGEPMPSTEQPENVPITTA